MRPMPSAPLPWEGGDVLGASASPAGPLPGAQGRPCRCGHGRAAHRHYRRGTDCSLCPCPRYHRRRRLPRVFGRRR